MSDTILVTYATRYGSTQEVAEKVAATLRESGLEVDVQPARKVQSLSGYRAVVLGAPLYIGSWLKEAQRFLKKHQPALEKLPVAIFSPGPTHGGENALAEVQPQMDKELGKYPWLKPVATELFGGDYDPDKLRFPDTLLTVIPASPLHDAAANDMRDWDAIRTWAEDLVGKL
jgi:menaquinone-dependent protoporphyrinogen oxidase